MALDRARRKGGPKSRLLVVLDLVTHDKRGRFQALPLSFFQGKWGLHLVVLYLVYGDPRLPWVYRRKISPIGLTFRGRGEKTLFGAPTQMNRSRLALSLLASLCTAPLNLDHLSHQFGQDSHPPSR